MTMPEPKIEKHFTMMLYPFQHDLSGSNRQRRLLALAERWQPWWNRLESHDAVVRAIDDTYFFLPHIRNLLFPELPFMPRSQTGATPDITLAQIASGVANDAVVRLTLLPQHRDPLKDLHLKGKRPDNAEFDYAFCLEWVDVALFPQDVGLLIFKVSLSAPLPVGAVVEFMREAQRIHPIIPELSVVIWTAGPDLKFTARDLVDFCLQGLTDLQDEAKESFVGFLRRSGSGDPNVTKPARYSETDAGEVYGEGFFRYSYACRPQDTTATGAPPQNAAPSPGLPSTTQAPHAAPADGLFADDETRILYQLATCCDLNDIDYIPHRQGLQHLLHQGHIAWWANWQGLALQSNVVFLGLSDKGFAANGLSHNAEYDYFWLYLITLYQRIRLSLLPAELVPHRANVHQHMMSLRALWNGFVRFRKQYWFAEVTLKPQGMELYRKFQEGLGTERLYRSIDAEVRIVQEHYENRSQRRATAVLNGIAFYGLPTATLASLFSSALVQMQNGHLMFPPSAWTMLGKVSLVVYPALTFIWWLWHRIDRE